MSKPATFRDLLLIFDCISLQKRDKRRRKAGLGTPRIICYASNFGLSLLRKAESWSSDGTFDVCPEPFYQLYTVHAHLGADTYPAAYFFMPGKKKGHYREALQELKAHLTAADPASPLPLRRYLIDLEVAVMSEVRTVFGRAVSVSGCHVHMRRNLRRRLQDLKYLQTLALKNHRFNFFIAAISALAYVPVDEVGDYYKALLEEELPSVLEDVRHQLEFEEDDTTERFSDINRSIQKYLDYVEATYIGKVVLICTIRTEN
jgi:hypothetical protein